MTDTPLRIIETERTLLARFREWWSGETANPVKRVQFDRPLTPWLFILPQMAVVVIIIIKLLQESSFASSNALIDPMIYQISTIR